MAGKNTSSAKKSMPKKDDGKAKDELQWEIKVCHAAIEKKSKDIKRTYHPLRVGFEYFGCTLLRMMIPLLIVSGIVCISGLWDAHPFLRYDFDDMELYTMGVLPLFFIGLCIELLIGMISEKREIVKNGASGKNLANDVIEILSERLRIAQLTLLANEMGTQLNEAERKYHLTFVDQQNKRCANCIHMGEVIKTTTTKYSDGTTSQSKSHEYFYCAKLNDAKVKKSNVCNEFLSKRVASAFDKAQKLFEETQAKMLEQEERSSVGFR